MAYVFINYSIDVGFGNYSSEEVSHTKNLSGSFLCFPPGEDDDQAVFKYIKNSRIHDAADCQVAPIKHMLEFITPRLPDI